jgi:hypothetical protein
VSTPIEVAVAPGDGIGPEIMDAVLQVFDAVGAPIRPRFIEMGRSVYQRGLSIGMTPDAQAAVESLGVLFKVLFGSGAMAKLSTAVYVAMGWVAIIAAKPLIASMDKAGLALLVGGGLFYTGGVVFYVDKRRAWTHPVWHLFVLGGSICHYFAVLFYSAPVTIAVR